tara:strand:- start:887 stop:1276 length:390 start_codon:yes stop_codon:yes gene_type:complete
MATKTLSASIDLKTTDNVIGIFDLDSVTAQNLSYDDTVVSSASVTVPHGGSGLQIVAAVGASAKVVYVWIKNMEAVGGNFVVLKNDAGNVWGRLLPGEWGFFPIALVAGFEAQADTADVICEYAIFQTP